MKRLRLLVLLGLGSCGSMELPASAVCERTADCEEGLTCLPVAQFSGNTCEEVGRACSTLCDDDADCAPLGDEFRCFSLCDTRKACGATQQ